MAAPVYLKLLDVWKHFICVIFILGFIQCIRCQNRYSLFEKIDLDISWTSEFANAPFITRPLLMDINGDGYHDVIGATFTEVIKVVDGLTGHDISDSNWPYYIHDASIHAAPIKHDIDNDGSLDILIFTTDAELIPLKSDGTVITEKSFKLPAVYIDKEWHEKEVRVGQGKIKQFVKDGTQEFIGEYVRVDPHILTDPLIVDLNSDDRLDEIILPVSFYLDKEYYSLQESEMVSLGIKYEELDNYLLSALVLYNLTSSHVIKTVYLDLSKATSNFPGYILFPPIVADLHGYGKASSLNILLGTSAGSLHVFDSQGNIQKPFPKIFGPIHGEITAVDIDQDGALEIIFIDTSANVVCLNVNGSRLWEEEISGTSSPGVELVDLNKDGYLDLVITTNDGKVWALNGKDGKPLPGWPHKLGKHLFANAQLVELNNAESNIQEIVVVVMSDDGKLYMITGDGKHKQSFQTGEVSLAPIIVSSSLHQKSAKIMVGTKDGALLAIAAGNRTLTNGITIQLLSSKFTVQIQTNGNAKTVEEVSGSWFTLHFSIIDGRWKKENKERYFYMACVYLGRKPLAKERFTSPGIYSIDINIKSHSLEGHIMLHVTNQYGESVTDTLPVKLNMNIKYELKWILFVPFAVNMIFLLLLYGFPATNYLPMTHSTGNQNKTS